MTAALTLWAVAATALALCGWVLAARRRRDYRAALALFGSLPRPSGLWAADAAMAAHIVAIAKAAAPFVALADEAEAAELSGVAMDGYGPLKASAFQFYAECAALRAALAGEFPA